MAVPHTSAKSCPTCGALADFIEIENQDPPPDGEVAKTFPAAVRRLQPPNPDIERLYRHQCTRLLACPDCDTYYRYDTWTPGGSEDCFNTYVHEAVRRIGALQTLELLRQTLADTKGSAERGFASDQADYEFASKVVGVQLERLKSKKDEILSGLLERLERPRDPGTPQVSALLRQLEANRVRDAEDLALMLVHGEPDEVPVPILRRTVELLADPNPELRAKIRDAAVQALLQVTAGKAREVFRGRRDLARGDATLEEMAGRRGTGRSAAAKEGSGKDPTRRRRRSPGARGGRKS